MIYSEWSSAVTKFSLVPEYESVKKRTKAVVEVIRNVSRQMIVHKHGP